MKWEEVKLKDITLIKKGDYITKNNSNPGKYPVILGGREPAYFIDKFNHTGKALVVSRSGASAGYISFWNEPIFVTDGFLIEPKEGISYEYLYFLLKSKQYELQRKQQGAAIPHVTPLLIQNIEIKLPPFEIRTKIADILSTYDDLIENNQKQIKLLEEAAQRLYKEWFVDLRFPGHEQTKIIDGVPEGWKNNILSDIADISMGQSPKSEFYNDKKDGLPFHQGVGSYGNRFVIDNVYTTSYTRIAEPDSILFSVRAPVGRLNRTKNRIVIGRGLSAINHKKGCQGYLFYLLKNKFFKDNILGNGSIFASISKDELANQKLIIPTDSLVERFNSQVKSIDDKIDILDSQNELLKETRDRLLPKLMSGEIEV